MSYDTVIKGGRVFDGSGNPWFKADLGIKDGQIKAGMTPKPPPEGFCVTEAMVSTGS